jgi:hypothetical protein
VADLHQLAAACHADIEFGDLFSQGIAVDAQEIGTFCLISGCRIQRDLDQRDLHFAQNPVIHPRRRQLAAMEIEIALQVAGEVRKYTFLAQTSAMLEFPDRVQALFTERDAAWQRVTRPLLSP